jgi:hypothetical protein
VRFTPGPFRYNGRVALALLPAMLVAAVLGGRPVLATLTMGALMWYIMDAMQYREGAFTVVRPSRAHTYTTDLPPPRRMQEGHACSTWGWCAPSNRLKSHLPAKNDSYTLDGTMNETHTSPVRVCRAGARCCWHRRASA